jgi:hypothetical protein
LKQSEFNAKQAQLEKRRIARERRKASHLKPQHRECRDPAIIDEIANGATLAQTARKWKLSRSRVQQIYQSALRQKEKEEAYEMGRRKLEDITRTEKQRSEMLTNLIAIQWHLLAIAIAEGVNVEHLGLPLEPAYQEP